MNDLLKQVRELYARGNEPVSCSDLAYLLTQVLDELDRLATQTKEPTNDR